jgi:hypothetical protein
VGIIAVYAGPVAEGERVLEPLREFGPPVADLIRPMPYTAVQTMLDDAVPIGDRYYWKSNFVDHVSPGLANVLIGGAGKMPSPHSMILVFEIKGAIRRSPKNAMAFITTVTLDSNSRSLRIGRTRPRIWPIRDGRVRFGAQLSRSYRRRSTQTIWIQTKDRSESVQLTAKKNTKS